MSTAPPMIERYPPEVLEAAKRAIQNAPDANRFGVGYPPGLVDVHEVATALLYIVGGPVKQLPYLPRNPITSYGWKQRAQRWGRTVGLSPYVSNGAFIVAADSLRVPSQRRPNCPNVAYALKTTREASSALLHAWHRHGAQS